MASILQTEQDKDKDQPGSMTFGQQAGDISSGQQQQGSPLQSQAPTPKGSGRFTNLKKYVEANQPQATQMAGKIGGGIAEKAQQAKQGAMDIQSQFGQQAQQEQERLGQTGQYVSQLGTAQGAQGILQSPEELKKFQQIRQGQLGLNQADLSQQQQQLQALQEQGKLAGTEAGRFQLLRQNFGTPTYSLGQRKLDQLLLQASPGATQAMQNQINPALAGLGQTIGGVQQDVGSRFTGLQGLAGEQQQALNQALTGGVSGIESQLEAAKLAAETGRKQSIDQFGTNVSTKNLSADQLAALGPQFQDPYSSLYDINLNDYLKQGPLPDINIGQVTSPEQAQRYASLQQLGDLTGKYSGLTPDQTQINMLPLDTDRLYQELANKRSSFENQFIPKVQQFEGNTRASQTLPTSESFQSIIRNFLNGPDNIATRRGQYYDPLMNALTGAGLDQLSASNIMNNKFMNYAPGGTSGYQDPSGLSRYLLEDIPSVPLNNQNALREFAQKQGALNMISDYNPAVQNQNDEAQFQELLKRYSGRNVGALS